MKIAEKTTTMDSAVGRKSAAAPWGVGLALVTLLASAAAPAAAHSQAPQQRSRTALTNADSGRTVSARTGDDVEVRLTGYRENGLTYTWEVPASSDGAVLHRTAGGKTPSGDATARFHVEQDGTATLSAVRHCRSGGGHLCPQVVTPWKVRVEVN